MLATPLARACDSMSDVMYGKSFRPQLSYFRPLTRTKSRKYFANVKASIDDRCTRFRQPLSKEQLDYFYESTVVDDNHKVIYCPVWKSGSTSWRAVMLVLQGSFKTLDDAVKSVYGIDGLTTLKSYKNRSEIELRLRTYKKFMAYREPLNRFAADYVMLRRSGIVYELQSRGVVEYVNSVRGRRDPKHSWQNMTIWDFAKFVSRFGNETTKMIRLDKQWIPQNMACYPCHIHYDYYIDMESSTVNRDSRYLLMILGAPHWLKMPHVNPTTKDKTPYLSQLSEPLYNRLVSVYYNDYEIFGFKKPERSRMRP
ncbi:carbohydrate sulfotransferase 14-like isoform X2 [Corticium candelabrum]|uniref:carbohydrate sulfotransferase 14-like isoform X2 n=1 Tax=Corticium candelabrum TaxID=121492 RepID=UPI002E25AD72|nr:carbohydrate sulfotransferase 14-like isoform X2 [Corticium candelabrum]